jgi:hypothetical protein
MEQSAYLISIAAGVFYLIAGYRLLRLSRRTGEHPELLLGIYFAFSGLWYVLYNAPYLLGMEALPPLIGKGIEWLYVVGVVPYLLFIRSAFRPGSAWATAVVIVCTLFMFAGAIVTSVTGELSITLDDPAFLIEWIGYTVPCVWMCCEGALSNAAARKRVRIGLCDPIVANRYLLFACFGFCQTAACASELSWAYVNSTGAASSSISEVLLGGTEIASVAVLWLAFFPPLVYRRWIDGRAASLSTPAEEA